VCRDVAYRLSLVPWRTECRLIFRRTFSQCTNRRNTAYRMSLSLQQGSLSVQIVAYYSLAIKYAFSVQPVALWRITCRNATFFDIRIFWVQIVASVCLVYTQSPCRVQCVATFFLMVTLPYRLSLQMLSYVYLVYNQS
jgi:hypothetical protein